MEEDLTKKIDTGEIVKRGIEIYEEIKDQYDPKEKGKFLAIEVESEKVYLGATSIEALESAKKEYPDKVFYLVKIGYDVVETLLSPFIIANHSVSI